MPTRLTRRFALCFLALCCLLAGTAQSAPKKNWSITEVGVLAAEGSITTGLNNRGDVVGWSPVNTVAHAVLWQNGSNQDLGMTVGDPPGSAFSYAAAVNDHGAVVGSANGDVYLWSAGVPAPLGFTGVPTSINKRGIVAGGRWTAPIGQGGRFLGFIFDNGVLHHLPTLGGDSANVVAINDKGVAVGHSSISIEGRLQAFVYESGVITNLGTLGGSESFANAINDRGVVVGTSQDANGDYVAFIREPGQPMRQLLPAFSGANAINDRGTIVGQLHGNGFVLEDGELTMLVDIAQVRAAGWTLLFPFRINDRGWIAGYGLRTGSTHYSGFLLVPR